MDSLSNAIAEREGSKKWMADRPTWYMVPNGEFFFFPPSLHSGGSYISLYGAYTLHVRLASSPLPPFSPILVPSLPLVL